MQEAEELERRTDYKVDTSALGIDAQKDLAYFPNAMRRSLLFHAEKVALVCALKGPPGKRIEQGDIFIKVSLNVCADCMSYFAHQASLTGRRLVLRDPKEAHIFEA